MLTLWLACKGEDPTLPAGGDDDDDPAVTDTAAPTPTDTGTVPPEAALSLRIHDRIGSIVVASWDQPADATVHLEYSFDPGVWLSSPDRPVVAGPAEELLLGIPFGVPVTARLGPTGPEATLTTAPLPDGFPVPTLLTADPTRVWTDGAWLLGSINSEPGGWTDGRYWMFVVDRLGRVVWAMPGVDRNFTIYLQISLDNDILWDESSFWSEFDGGASSKIHRMKIDGTEVEVLDAPGMHHCFIEMPDRSILWGASDGFETERLLRRAPDGTVTTTWECAPFYDQLGLDDWCHTNSIFYQASTDRLLLSFPTDRTFVLEVDATTGEELRWFGHVPQSWAFDQPSSAFQYQHGATWTDAGTLLLSSQLTGNDPDALVREYTLDEASQTLTQIWASGAGDGIDADNAGEAHRLPNGNTLHNTGTTPRVLEIAPDGTVVWDLGWPGNRLVGRTVWLGPDGLYALAP